MLASDEMIQKKVSEGWSYRDIQKVRSVGSSRIAAVAKSRLRGTPGRPRKFGDDIIEFIESNFLCDARITDYQMKGMVKETFQQKISRSQVCKIRNKLEIKYRKPITVLDCNGESISGVLSSHMSTARNMNSQ